MNPTWAAETVMPRGASSARIAWVSAQPAAFEAGGEEDLAAVSTMVGAMILARATAGSEISDRILAAARKALG
nr:hypothetical protein [uncultured Actinoplanes sp.]